MEHNGNEVIGCWSSEQGYYDAWEDQELVFKPDGTGWYEYRRPRVSNYTLFHWHIAEPGVLTLEPYQSARSGAPDATRRVEGAIPAPVKTAYDVAPEPDVRLRERGRTIVLRLDIPFAVVARDGYGLMQREAPTGHRPFLPWLDTPDS